MSNTRLAEGLVPGGSPGTGTRGRTPVAPFAVQSGEGTALETPLGDVITIKAATRQTNGSLTVMELVIGPKKGPALHTHLREDELWYVLDGDFRFKAGDAMLRVSTGGMAFGPRGTPHAFQNIGEAPGRLLVITTPSGLERFFEEFAALLPGPAGPEALTAVGHANWAEFTGPAVGVSDPL
jgi:mannose-6-phosphate isomerase-like protein (cupin superfamily)